MPGERHTKRERQLYELNLGIVVFLRDTYHVLVNIGVFRLNSGARTFDAVAVQRHKQEGTRGQFYPMLFSNRDCVPALHYR